jgi:hypothetical protein
MMSISSPTIVEQLRDMTVFASEIPAIELKFGNCARKKQTYPNMTI